MTDRIERVCGGAENPARDIPSATPRMFAADEKMRIVLEGLRGVVLIDHPIADMAIETRLGGN